MDSDFKILAIVFGAIFVVMIGAEWWKSHASEKRIRTALEVCAPHLSDEKEFPKCVERVLEVSQ